MAVHLSIGRIRSVSLVVLVGLAAVAGAVQFLIHPGPEVETVPGLRSTAVAPRTPVHGRRAASRGTRHWRPRARAKRRGRRSSASSQRGPARDPEAPSR